MDAIEYNRRAIVMEKLFPRRFEDLDEKILQKKQEASADKWFFYFFYYFNTNTFIINSNTVDDQELKILSSHSQARS